MRHWVKAFLFLPVTGLLLAGATPVQADTWRWGARALDRVEDRLDRLDRREDRFDRRHGPHASWRASRLDRRLDREERRWQRRAARRAYYRGWRRH